jgi:hypothetical protein
MVIAKNRRKSRILFTFSEDSILTTRPASMP